MLQANVVRCTEMACKDSEALRSLETTALVDPCLSNGQNKAKTNEYKDVWGIPSSG